VLASASAKTYAPKTNPNSLALTRYRELMAERFPDAVVASSGKGDRAAIKRSIGNFGLEPTLQAMAWVFQHWSAYQAAIPKLQQNRFPLRTLFYDGDWMTMFVDHAKSETVPKPAHKGRKGGSGVPNWHRVSEQEHRDQTLDDAAMAQLKDLLK